MTDSHRDIGAPYIARVDRDETHDPLCPWFGSGDPWATGSSVHTCSCELIRRVRADEKERLIQKWSEENHGVRFNHAHDDLNPVQRVAKWLKNA